MFILLALFFISWAIYTCFYFKMNKVNVFLFKMLTSTLLLAFGISAYIKEKDSVYALLIIIGLFFGVCGDFFLGMQRLDRKRKQMHLILGIASFFLGHVFYIFAFERTSHLSFYIFFPTAIIIMLLSFLFIHFQKLELGKAKKLCYAYLIISAFFLTFAFGTFASGIIPLSIFVALGAFSFSASDFILAFLYFRSVKRYRFLKYINIVLYYLGQLLLVSTILLI